MHQPDQAYATAAEALVLEQSRWHQRNLFLYFQGVLETALAEQERLLHEILPKQIVGELQRTGHVEPVIFPDAAVVFTEFDRISATYGWKRSGPSAIHTWPLRVSWRGTSTGKSKMCDTPPRRQNLLVQPKTIRLCQLQKTMPALAPYKPSPIWRKNRLVARIILRKQRGRGSDRDIRLARHFRNDPEILDRLLDQAIHSLSAPLKSHNKEWLNGNLKHHANKLAA